jgi:hypothetical protein
MPSSQQFALQTHAVCPAVSSLLCRHMPYAQQSVVCSADTCRMPSSQQFALQTCRMPSSQQFALQTHAVCPAVSSLLCRHIPYAQQSAVCSADTYRMPSSQQFALQTYRMPSSRQFALQTHAVYPAVSSLLCRHIPYAQQSAVCSADTYRMPSSFLLAI